jgi:hypothetical protein
MKKIPTVFRRDPDNLKTVLPEVTPGCEWVLAGEGVPTRKYDGTCCMFDGSQWWARREVKPGKPHPPEFQLVDIDQTTGKRTGWVPMADSAFAKWHAEAVANPAMDYGGEGPTPGTYELVGPKINGNPERTDDHRLIAHKWADVVEVVYLTPDFEALRDLVLGLGVEGVEGVVWHHPDGRMAKLKARDFLA